MDERTLQQIDGLVTDFQQARDESARRQVTLRAERELQFIDGALERFALRIRSIGNPNFSPGVLDEEAISPSGDLYAEIRAEENDAVDSFVAEYEAAGSDQDRRTVLEQASKRFAGSPLALNSFNSKTGLGAAGESPVTSAPETTVPTSTVPMSTPGTTAVPAPPVSTRAPGREPQAQSPTVQPAATGGASVDVPSTFTPSQLINVVEVTRQWNYATSVGMPRSLALRVAESNVNEGVTFEQFQSDLDLYIASGYEQQTINELYETKLEGIDYQLPQAPPSGVATKPRLVLDENAVGPNRTITSQQPGISNRDDGYKIMRNPDNSRFVYDPNNAEVFLEELSAEKRNELSLWLYTRGMISDPQNYSELVNGTATVLQNANMMGRDLQWTLDTMDELSGFNMDKFYNRLSGPIVVYDREEAFDQANAYAAERLGRGLTRSEQLAVIDAFDRRNEMYRRESIEASIRANFGEQVTVQQAPTLESMTTQWLERTKPAEVQQAKDYSVMRQLMDMTFDGAFGEFVPLTEDFKFGAGRE